MKSKIFTVTGLIMTAIFMMYFILAVNFTNALFPDKNSSYIALGAYVAAVIKLVNTAKKRTYNA